VVRLSFAHVVSLDITVDGGWVLSEAAEGVGFPKCHNVAQRCVGTREVGAEAVALRA
jgi:hypothetical protein